MTSGQNIPEFEIQFNQLPSRGIGYPSDAKIYYRGYTTGELNKIASIRADSITHDFLFKITLEGIRTEKMDKLDLSYIDLLSLGLRRRISSEGDLKFKMSYRCEKCLEREVLVFGHSDIKFNYISENFKVDEESFEVKLPIKIKIKDVECEFTYPTVRNMFDLKDKKVKDKISALNALTIKNIDFDKAYDLLSNLTEFENLEDIENLSMIGKIIHHDIADIQATCKNEVLNKETDQKVVCNHVNLVSVEGKELLLKPFRESKTPSGNKIRFGN